MSQTPQYQTYTYFLAVAKEANVERTAPRFKKHTDEGEKHDHQGQCISIAQYYKQLRQAPAVERSLQMTTRTSLSCQDKVAKRTHDHT